MEIRDATTPAEMRAEIYRLRNESPLVCAVMQTADYSGLSAEDRFTVLAYLALKESARNQQMLIKQLEVATHPFLVAPISAT